MSVKQIFKTFYNNLKSWGWYEWVKYTLATFLLIVGVFGLPIFVFFMVALAWLVIKDFRLPHIIIILLSVVGTIMSLQYLGIYYDDYPQMRDVIFWILAIVSIICICKITAKDSKILGIKSKDNLDIILSVAALVALIMYFVIYIPFIALDFYYPDYKDVTRKECIETKVAKGYPRDFAREYCLGEGDGCVEKGYDKDCQVDVRCCFATIEEDKKWNYLDYDEQGNKIKE